MVIGLDHYTKGNSSIYSMVATTNPSFSAYWSNSSFGGANFTFSDFLNINLPKAIDCFYKINGIMPISIIVFREGVSKGQVAATRLSEVAVFKDLFAKM